VIKLSDWGSDDLFMHILILLQHYATANADILMAEASAQSWMSHLGAPAWWPVASMPSLHH